MTSIVLEWHNEVAEKQIDEAMKRLKAAAMEIKGVSQAMCPVKSGTLRGSAYVDDLENGYEIGYGGAAESYALDQHENLHYYHKVGQAKFLELAFLEVTEKRLKSSTGERTVISTWGDETKVFFNGREE
jgi:hypothetical protein